PQRGPRPRGAAHREVPRAQQGDVRLRRRDALADAHERRDLADADEATRRRPGTAPGELAQRRRIARERPTESIGKLAFDRRRLAPGRVRSHVAPSRAVPTEEIAIAPDRPPSGAEVGTPHIFDVS